MPAEIFSIPVPKNVGTIRYRTSRYSPLLRDWQCVVPYSQRDPLADVFVG
jgi:hypothetical protein